MLKPPAPDPSLDPFRDGVAELTQNGEVAGHVFASVDTFWSPSRPLSRQWWVWFVVVWANGDRERPFEDYPPWATVGEIQSGKLTWDDGDTRAGEYAVQWLDPGAAEAVRKEVGITQEDF